MCSDDTDLFGLTWFMGVTIGKCVPAVRKYVYPLNLILRDAVLNLFQCDIAERTRERITEMTDLPDGLRR